MTATLKNLFRPLAVLALLALSSCASHQSGSARMDGDPLSAADRAAMKGRSVIATGRGMPPFGVMPTNLMRSIIVPSAGFAVWNATVNRAGGDTLAAKGVPDPQQQISKPLLKTLAAKAGARSLGSPWKRIDTDDAEQVARLYPRADYVLDVHTYPWCATEVKGGRYGMAMSTSMTLVERSSGRVVARSHDIYVSGADATTDLAGIHADRAAYIKGESAKAVSQAVRRFSAIL